ncbi:hypothetical protein [Gemmatimonas sp.]|uniref:hypothetical protein n=1 Tax=Gemmatimonas sp. TaxID=1962908 RepID=UPI00286D620C|nr:hypothetical protein [Gemmatimonas sp.]
MTASIAGAQSAAPVALSREIVLDGATEDFSEVNGGRVNSRGDIALTLRQDFQVRIYDTNGRRIAAIGRRGSGPGEFQTPQVQGWNADTVWIYDFGLRRHSFFTRTGQLVRITPLETAQRQVRVINEGSEARLVDFSPSARRADGSLLGAGTILRTSGGARSARELVVASYSTDGKARKLASLEADPRWEQALASTNMVATSPNGDEVLAVSVSDLSLTGSSVLLSRMSASGSVLSSTRLPYRGLEYPAARRDSVLRRGTGVDRSRSVPSSMAPSVVPPVWGALLRNDGMALLTMQDTPNSFKVVMVDRKGVVRGEFRLPKGHELLAARDAHVWLRTRNSDDIVSLVRYRLRCSNKQAC